jgi:DNA-binding ferritin-like protein
MKKFTDFNSFKRLYEQEITLGQTTNAEETITTPIQEVEQPTEQTEQPQTVTKSEPAKFFSKLLESREMAQVYHWQVKGDEGSHSAHIALNEYYDAIIEHIDELVEVYQGQYDLIEEYDVIDTKETKTKDKIEYFQEVVQFIKDTRYKAVLEEDTHLQNTIDEVVATIYKLLYKLRFNR